MNFFEAQARAKRHTVRLILLFALAVAGLVALTNLVVLLVVGYGNTGVLSASPAFLAGQFDWAVFAGVTLFVVLTILFGSVYKSMALSGGGRSVAEMLGGRLIPGNTRDFHERRLVNVVEEMAIASGIPVPPVYVLEEPGINAFAAGTSPNTAVIGVTRGALEYLDRDELQGVIAHEFSHVFNGDMRLSLRLIGVLHGILLLALLGYYLLRSARYARRSRGQGAGAEMAVPVIGLGLMAIGSVGYFFGQWIKATISRQRELLADASAVQYTRNREGIAGALKKIGGLVAGSGLQTPAAAQYSHAYFARGVSGALQSLFATHPPLKTRIRRIDPQWDGRFVTPQKAQPAPGAAPGEDARVPAAAVAGAVAAAVLSADQLIARVGTVGEEQVGLAREIIAAIPARLRDAAEEPFGARAVVYGLLLDAGGGSAQAQQEILAARADPHVARLTLELQADVAVLPAWGRLPLVELTVPALQALSPEQYRRFRAVVGELILADRRVDFGEWILRRFLIRQLDQSFGLRRPIGAGRQPLEAVHREIEFLLSLFAHTDHPDGDEAQRAFAAGAAALGISDLRFMRRDELSLKDLDEAVDRLEGLEEVLRPRLLTAWATCILFDGKPRIEGLELLRTLASCLDSPMPPVPGTMRAVADGAADAW